MIRPEFEEVIEGVCTIVALETPNREHSDEEMSGEDSENKTPDGGREFN